MSADDRVQRIAEATGYRHNHIRRILKTINPPDHVKAQMVVDLFKIPQDKASLIVRMAQEDVEPPEDTPRGSWLTRLFRLRRTGATGTGAASQRGMTNLYVIRLDKAVLQRRKFREVNPDYRWWKPCVYVGVTALDPQDRFKQHKASRKASRTVTKYHPPLGLPVRDRHRQRALDKFGPHGRRLMPRLDKHLNPVPSAEAKDQERGLAECYEGKGTACGSTDASPRRSITSHCVYLTCPNSSRGLRKPRFVRSRLGGTSVR